MDVKLKSIGINENKLDNIPKFFKNMGDKALYEFDYEINKVQLDSKEELNTKMFISDRYNPRELRIVNYNEYKDNLIDLSSITHKNAKIEKIVDLSNNTSSIYKNSNQKTLYKTFCIKKLVSKKKRRYQDSKFDLDMTYVTKRVIAMGFPSKGCEALYRNSLNDVTNLFRIKHNNNVKVYNLCVEKNRIYKKELFPNSSVTLFPSKDHNPCPIKLILEFCVDLVLYLTNNPCSIGAVHCKAGKGRTGVMICSYLIFSGLCTTAEQAFEYYAIIRTYNCKGVTIPSQKRYVKYFETFLSTNFCKPYVHMIPQIIKYYSNGKTKNILKNIMEDERYFLSPNKFYLRYIRIGPLPKKTNLTLNICNFVYKPILLKYSSLNEISKENEGQYYYVFNFTDKVIIDSDIKIKIGGDLDFYIWINFWYTTLEIIKLFLENTRTVNVKESNVTFNINKYNYNYTESSKGESNYDNSNINNNIDKKYKADIEMKNINNRKYSDLSRKDIHTISEDDSERMFKLDEVDDSNYKIKDINLENEDNIDVFQIVDKLSHSTNLNKIIEVINMKLKKKKKNLLVNDFITSLSANELDKFKLVKKMKDNFKFVITYNMEED